MSRHETTTGHGAAREWKIGLAVVLIGFVVAILVAAYLTFGSPFAKKPVIPATAHIDARQVCFTGLAEATKWGILPQYTKLANGNLFITKQPGRYVCATATPSASYAIIVDLVCARLTSDKCVSLIGVSRDDGVVLFKKLHTP